jgi:hypothetical protein
MQLGFAHRPLEAEQQTIVEAGRIINAVLIEDQGRSQCAQFDQPVPIGGVAGEAGDLQAHDDSGLAEHHLADEFLEAVAHRGGRAGLAEITIDDAHPLGRPACGNRTVTQRVLTLCALAVLGDLPQGRLTHVEIGVALEVFGSNFDLRHGLVRR